MKDSLLISCCIVLCLVPTGSYAQKATQTISVTGVLRSGKTSTASDLQQFALRDIGDVAITNHAGEAKGMARAMKGVLLRDLLAQVKLQTDNPKLNSEYYFVCKATDGYKAVYSWNELFNTSVGDHVYIVLEKDEKNMSSNDDRILMVSAIDIRTGRRYIKNLETIYVERAD